MVTTKRAVVLVLGVIAYMGFFFVAKFFIDDDIARTFFHGAILFDTGGGVPLLGCAFPLLLLASIVERPFLTAAGIRQYTLAMSLQANLLGGIAISSLFRGLQSDVASQLLKKMTFEAPFLLLVMLWAVAATIEWYYLRRRERTLGDSAFRLILNANLVSFFSVPLVYGCAKSIATMLGNALWNYSSTSFWRWSRYGVTAYNALIVVSAIIFAFSFVWPYLWDQVRKRQN